MIKMVKIKFDNSNRIYYFKCDELAISKNQYVVVETDKGKQIGKCISNIIEIDENSFSIPIKDVLSIASDPDLIQHRKNCDESKKALIRAKKIASDLNMNMNLLNAYFTFDRNQLIFNFTSDDRVDFRELAKKLASIYKTRIELRQIGVRDKAKEVGGIGPCGRFLCCNLFLNEFESVSINMAKNQYISLKPDKINGLCGRLLCCLEYEDEQYTMLKKEFPTIGTIFKYNNEDLRVTGHNLLKRTIVAENRMKESFTLELNEYESIK